MDEGIIQYITNYSGVTFTVNVGAVDVPLLLAGTPDLAQNTSIKHFPEGSGCLIESIQIIFPYQFGLGSNSSPLEFQLGWSDSTGTNTGNLTEFGNAGKILIPQTNQEYTLFNYLNYPSAAADKWKIQIIGVTGGRVNMFNTPAILDTTSQAIRLSLKVRTALAMIA